MLPTVSNAAISGSIPGTNIKVSIRQRQGILYIDKTPINREPARRRSRQRGEIVIAPGILNVKRNN